MSGRAGVKARGRGVGREGRVGCLRQAAPAAWGGLGGLRLGCFPASGANAAVPVADRLRCGGLPAHGLVAFEGGCRLSS